jgi:predicted lipid-binding transport protein (Tim44 family)
MLMPRASVAAARSANPAAPAAAAPRRPWGAMLGGLAAGLGLAWLASSLGLGEEFGQFMLIALGVLLVMMALGWFMRARQASQRRGASPFAFQGAAPGDSDASAPAAYRVENVGNDASARPWERNSGSFDAATYAPQGSGSMIGSGIKSSGQWTVPPEFDVHGFVAAAKANFVTMQGAWDRADLGALRAMMTNDMLAEIRTQLAEREAHSGGAPNNTEVVMLDGKLLGVEDLGQDYMASVEFSGMVREQPSSGPSPFREVWNMTKPKDGSSGWLVAGVQALQ